MLLSTSPVFADPLTISLGIPQEHTFSEKNESGNKIETDGPSGYFLGIKFLIGFGLGMDSHKIKGDTSGSMELHTNMYNLFYQLPIPVINLILGLGTGNQEYKCDDNGNGLSCSDIYDKGSATQLYTSLGFPIMPLFDLHISYRMITSKNMKVKASEEKIDYSGSITGIGIAFNF